MIFRSLWLVLFWILFLMSQDWVASTVQLLLRNHVLQGSLPFVFLLYLFHLSEDPKQVSSKDVLEFLFIPASFQQLLYEHWVWRCILQAPREPTGTVIISTNRIQPDVVKVIWWENCAYWTNEGYGSNQSLADLIWGLLHCTLLPTWNHSFVTPSYLLHAFKYHLHVPIHFQVPFFCSYSMSPHLPLPNIVLFIHFWHCYEYSSCSGGKSFNFTCPVPVIRLDTQ